MNLFHICYVCDSNLHLLEVMRMNFDPSDIFMTIRTFNKYMKEHCYHNAGEVYLQEEGINIKYLVRRYKKNF